MTLRTSPRSGTKRNSVAGAKSGPGTSSSKKKVTRSGKTRVKVAVKGKRKRGDDEDSDASEGEDEDEYKEDSEESDVDEKQYDSDALDEDSDHRDTKKKQRVKTKTSSPKKKVAAASRSPTKKKRRTTGDKEEEDEFDGEVVGVIVKAPQTGRVPPGQISQNTLDFLNKLKDPKCNDREWFKLHEPVYRLAEQEWKDFIDSFTEVLTGVDSQIPPLPPKDVIHLVYRDVRFSNDKTPYKTNFCASFSRSGRKGIFAGYHISISPGGKSLIAAGSWCPGKNELTTIRANIQRSSTRLRRVLSAPAFVAEFGEAKPSADGGKQNVFGSEDELKVAPKGVDKGHKDIDLLKCRSFAVFRNFEDEEVLDEGFKQRLEDLLRVTRPFVHCLNDMMTVGGGGGEDEDEDAEDAEDGDEEE